jgi:hypothetical protein
MWLRQIEHFQARKFAFSWKTVRANQRERRSPQTTLKRAKRENCERHFCESQLLVLMQQEKRTIRDSTRVIKEVVEPPWEPLTQEELYGSDSENNKPNLKEVRLGICKNFISLFWCQRHLFI